MRHDLKLIAIVLAKKEAKRLEQAAKKAAKGVKATVVDAQAPEQKKKDKAAASEKPKKEEDAPFVNNTPIGDKKGARRY